MSNSIKVAVTGGAGQISYSLLFRLASGEVFGKNCRINLHLLELPTAMNAAAGVAMELRDCGFPTLGEINIFSEPAQAFDGVHWALMVGAKPRTAGMERVELVQTNAGIFVAQGRALAKADSQIRVVVVGNPCNTNALIAAHCCPDIPSTRFTAMTMLDENRAKSQIAEKLQTNVSEIKNLCIWGNHSPTMYPDFENATVGEEPLVTRCERAWLEEEFTTRVKQRGTEIIKARGSSSAASAASSCIDHIERLTTPTPAGEYFSAAVLAREETYGVPAGLMFSFPMTVNAQNEWQIAQNVPVSAYGQKMLQITTDDLLAEKEMVKDFLR